MRPLSWTRLSALLLALACLSSCFVVSPQHPEWRDKSNALLAAQEKNAEQIKGVGRAKKVIYAAFALNSDSKAFQGDVTLVRDVIRSINAQAAALLLSNQLEFSELIYPFGTKDNVKRALSTVARLADKETLVFLLFSTHGTSNRLNITIANGDYSDNLTSKELKSYLEALQSVPTILIISACYSGSFVADLSADNRIIITSASRDRSSFGCSFTSKTTYFIEEFFQNNFAASLSLSALFSQAAKQVEAREKKERLTPSQPQMFVGERMKKLASLPLRELLRVPSTNP